ncbi:hypothetical protein Hdeb2414_s0008g00287181 [Helianthus debilis subsp. tardiflorus]
MIEGNTEMHDREDTHHDAGGHYEISEIQDDDVGFNIETDGNEDIQVTTDAATDAAEVPDVNGIQRGFKLAPMHLVFLKKACIANKLMLCSDVMYLILNRNLRNTKKNLEELLQVLKQWGWIIRLSYSAIGMVHGLN